MTVRAASSMCTLIAVFTFFQSPAMAGDLLRPSSVRLKLGQCGS
jgi:hypothetical protein